MLVFIIVALSAETFRRIYFNFFYGFFTILVRHQAQFKQVLICVTDCAGRQKLKIAITTL